MLQLLKYAYAALSSIPDASLQPSRKPGRVVYSPVSQVIHDYNRFFNFAKGPDLTKVVT